MCAQSLAARGSSQALQWMLQVQNAIIARASRPDSTIICRAELQAYTKAKTDEILNLNNSISRLKTELEDCEAESYAQESKKDYSLQVASQKTLEYGQVGLLLHGYVDGAPGWGLAPLAATGQQPSSGTGADCCRYAWQPTTSSSDVGSGLIRGTATQQTPWGS